MDNNFNMQQNNAQQPMGQPMYQQAPQQQMYQQPMGQQAPQQQMYQQPMGQQAPQQQMYQQPTYNNQYQQPKKNTGLIIGIIVGVVALIAIIVTIVLVLVLGGDKDKDKKNGKNGASSTKNYLIGTWESEDGVEMVFNKDNTGTLYGFEIEWNRSGDTLTITLSYGSYEYEEEYTIADLSEDTMVLENEDGDEMEFTKVD